MFRECIDNIEIKYFVQYYYAEKIQIIPFKLLNLNFS